MCGRGEEEVKELTDEECEMCKRDELRRRRWENEKI